jgi:hypothetical protein
MTATAQSPLALSYIPYTEDNSLQSAILTVVDGIISQDSTDRGAWTYVIIKRVARDTSFTEQEVIRELERMLHIEQLYKSCYEILEGILHIVYVRSGDELLGRENHK